MSNLNMRHPDHGQLLLYLDGELSGSKSRQIRGHLEACWQCRTELQALEATVADCVKYRNNVLSQTQPPAQWKPLDFDRIEAELAAQSWTSRLAGWFTLPPVRWTATAAAAITLTFVAVNKLNQTPKV